MKERIVSGIQPSGEMHIGNYLGALKDFVELQDKFECFFFIADLHSLTEDFDPEEKTKQIMELAETFLALGLDPKKCTMFIQSHIPAHSELAWILNTVTPMNELERMTQYKDKALRQKKNINVGLFDYPVLQAADILLYHPQYVPVGHDQVQHLEMTNLIAKKFNNRYGEYFQEIKPHAKNPVRVMSLSEPEKKMSKSEPESTINIFDEPEIIKKKLAKAVTATDAPKGTTPKGVQNLFDLLETFGKEELLQKFKKEYNDNTIKYSELKSALADSISDYFSPMRTAKTKIHQNQDQIVEILQAGAAKAAAVANQTLSEIKTKLGLL
ncbi:MAG: tryptophan--tRNA ligase [Candidatus Doudnabacteria bacterium]|nr:tryptophan--tRNA ligase [Candidatus Doudnabacteria bacterium]